MKNTWDLYAGAPNFEEATKALDKACEAAIAEGRKLMKSLPANVITLEQVIQKMMDTHMYPAMNSFTGVGASDTEPREIAWEKIQNGIHFGKDEPVAVEAKEVPINDLVGSIRDALAYIYDDSSVPARALRRKMVASLRAAIEGAGFLVSGPTDHRAAEHGEPVWVCNAREAIANA
jgi:hypothetical protein